MNQLREAAQAIHEAETATPGLSVRMDVSRKYVHLVGRRGDFEIVRTASWDEIEQAKFNVLTCHLTEIIERLKAPA